VHEQETANATIGAFPGLASVPEPAPEKAVGQEARESVNRLIVAKGPADRLAPARQPRLQVDADLGDEHPPSTRAASLSGSGGCRSESAHAPPRRGHGGRAPGR
jgi:hypothetical protein